MFEIGSYVMYKQDVCVIKGIEKNKYTNLDSYVLAPVYDNDLKITTPVSNKVGYLRKLITLKEINKLIKEMPSIEVIKTDNRNLENEYRQLLHSGKHEDLVKIIKTAYLRNKKRSDSNRNIGEKDKEYFDKAEKYLYNELSIVLNKSFDETKKYIVDKVTKMGD